MMRRFLILILLAAGVLQAAEAVDTNRKRTNAPPNQVEMPFLIAPADRDNTLVGFYYISFRVITPSSDFAAKVRDKLGFIQDAYVRDVYRKTVSMATDPTQVDRTALHERLLAIARRFAGARNVQDLVFLDIKFAPLHPKPGTGIFATGSQAPEQPAAGQPAAGSPATSKPQKDGPP
jgi:hypothetical protein